MAVIESDVRSQLIIPVARGLAQPTRMAWLQDYPISAIPFS